MRFLALRHLFSTGKSIQAKIFVSFILVTLLTLVMSTSIMYVHLTANIKKNATNYVLDSMRQADVSIKMFFEEADRIETVVVSNQPNVIDVLRSDNYEVSYEWFLERNKIDNFLSALIDYKSYIARISVIGTNGKIFGVGGPPLDKFELQQDPAQTVLHSDGRRLYLPQSAQKTGGDRVLTIGRAIRYSGETIGAVMVYVKYDFIRKTYDIAPSPDSFIYILGGDDRLIYSSDPAANLPASLSTAVDSALSKSPNGAALKWTIGGKPYLLVGYRSDYTGWTTIGLIPYSALMRDSIALRGKLTEAAVIVFFLVLGVSVTVAARITRNLRKLRNSMRWVMEGNLTIPSSQLNTISARDEVGQLHQVFSDMVDRLKGLMEDIRTGERQKREAELAALQAQISPHFLYNALNTIKFMARMRNAANIEEVSSSIIGLLRGVLGNTREFVPLREEFDYVNSYVRIQRYKYFQPFHVNLQIEPEALDCIIPKLLLQPLVENAVIHGIGPLSQGGYVSVKAYRGSDGLKLEVTDNGVGMTQEQIEQAMRGHSLDRNHQFSGIGLSNVKERVALLYGEPYDLKIFSEPGVYTTAELLLPIRYEEGDNLDQSAVGG